MKAYYLVCYDIADERRLQKIYQFMKAYGMHIQYSVFLCKLGWQDLQMMKDALNTLVDIQEDDIRIYPIPRSMPVTVLGRGGCIPDGVDLYLS
jgi:CRISPR-associated protein Cas2